MKKYINLWQFVGFAFTSFLGTVLHFLYDLTGSYLVAPFSAINESTWEHMKILFFPMLIFALVQHIFLKKEVKSFFCVKLKGILLGLFLIPALFYTYNGAFGTSPDWINIAIFFISALCVYVYEAHLFKYYTRDKGCSLAFLVILLIAFLFVLFTFNPPTLPIFLSPVK